MLDGQVMVGGVTSGAHGPVTTGAGNSNAPTSVASLLPFNTDGLSIVRGKPGPRWSKGRPSPHGLLADNDLLGVVAQLSLKPWSIAGLLLCKAIVLVGPPFDCKPNGSSFGSSGDAFVPF